MPYKLRSLDGSTRTLRLVVTRNIDEETREVMLEFDLDKFVADFCNAVETNQYVNREELAEFLPIDDIFADELIAKLRMIHFGDKRIIRPKKFAKYEESLRESLKEMEGTVITLLLDKLIPHILGNVKISFGDKLLAMRDEAEATPNG